MSFGENWNAPIRTPLAVQQFRERLTFSTDQVFVLPSNVHSSSHQVHAAFAVHLRLDDLGSCIWA
jgi:hypothetical protein